MKERKRGCLYETPCSWRTRSRLAERASWCGRISRIRRETLDWFPASLCTLCSWRWTSLPSTTSVWTLRDTNSRYAYRTGQHRQSMTLWQWDRELIEGSQLLRFLGCMAILLLQNCPVLYAFTAQNSDRVHGDDIAVVFKLNCSKPGTSNCLGLLLCLKWQRPWSL